MASHVAPPGPGGAPPPSAPSAADLEAGASGATPASSRPAARPLVNPAMDRFRRSQQERSGTLGSLFSSIANFEADVDRPTQYARRLKLLGILQGFWGLVMFVLTLFTFDVVALLLGAFAYYVGNKRSIAFAKALWILNVVVVVFILSLAISQDDALIAHIFFCVFLSYVIHVERQAVKAFSEPVPITNQQPAAGNMHPVQMAPGTPVAAPGTPQMAPGVVMTGAGGPVVMSSSVSPVVGPPTASPTTAAASPAAYTGMPGQPDHVQQPQPVQPQQPGVVLQPAPPGHAQQAQQPGQQPVQFQMYPTMSPGQESGASTPQPSVILLPGNDGSQSAQVALPAGSQPVTWQPQPQSQQPEPQVYQPPPQQTYQPPAAQQESLFGQDSTATSPTSPVQPEAAPTSQLHYGQTVVPFVTQHEAPEPVAPPAPVGRRAGAPLRTGYDVLNPDNPLRGPVPAAAPPPKKKKKKGRREKEDAEASGPEGG